MLLVECNDHFYDLRQEGEGKLEIEDAESPWGLSLLYTQGLEFGYCEAISPPVGFASSVVGSAFEPSCEFSFVPDVGNSGQVRIVHNK